MSKPVQLTRGKANLAVFQSKRVMKEFRAPFWLKVTAAVLVSGLILLAPKDAFSQSKGAKKAKTEQVADSLLNVKVLADTAIINAISAPVNKIMEERGAQIRAGKYLSSFRMPSTDVSVDVLDAKGEYITTLDGATEVALLRRNGFKSLMGSLMFICPKGSEWAHVFEKAEKQSPTSVMGQ